MKNSLLELAAQCSGGRVGRLTYHPKSTGLRKTAISDRSQKLADVVGDVQVFTEYVVRFGSSYAKAKAAEGRETEERDPLYEQQEGSLYKHLHNGQLYIKLEVVDTVQRIHTVDGRRASNEQLEALKDFKAAAKKSTGGRSEKFRYFLVERVLAMSAEGQQA